MKIKILLISLVALSLLLLLSCSEKKQGKVVSPSQNKDNQNVYDPRKPMSWGKDQVIYVFADPDIWKASEYDIKNSLERPFYTSENEKLYEVVHGDVKALDQFYKYKNLLFLCDMSSNQPVSEYIKKIMNEQMKEMLTKNPSLMFAKHNMFANEQFVVFLISNSKDQLIKSAFTNSNEMFYHFRQKFVQRLEYRQNKLKALPDKYFKDFPFTMRIPENYVVYKSLPNENFISFIWRSREDQKLNPDKYISVYYEKSDHREVSKEWIHKTRAKVAWKFYDEDEMNEPDLQWGLFRFLDYPAWYMSGRWQNKKYFIGGAFQSIAFYDEKAKANFLIDTSVYFPQGQKLKYLMELESIAKSFTPKP